MKLCHKKKWFYRGIASLEKFRLENQNRLIFDHLNINSIRDKFELLTNIIQGKLDLASETKIDISFPSGQFMIPGFAPPYRFDRNSKGGGLLLCLREDIPSKTIFIFKLQIEGFLVAVNICRKKWLLGCFYNILQPFTTSELNKDIKNRSRLRNSHLYLKCYSSTGVFQTFC